MLQARRAAGARHERRLFAVACKRLLAIAVFARVTLRAMAPTAQAERGMLGPATELRTFADIVLSSIMLAARVVYRSWGRPAGQSG